MNARGFTLIELMMGLGVVACAATAVVMLGAHVLRVQHTQATVEATYDLIDAIERGYGATGSFSNLDNASLISSGLAPSRLQQGGVLATDWGPILVAPKAVDGRSNAAFALTFQSVPTDACPSFVRGLSKGQSRILIDDVAVVQEGQLDETAMAGACSQDVVVQLIHDGGHPGSPAS